VKVITAKNWNLTPAADGRRYSKFPDGGATFNVWVSATIDGVEPGYRIKPPGGEWGAWQAGHTEGLNGGTGFEGVTTAVVGTAVASPPTFADVSGATVDTLTESAAVVISAEGHEIQVRRKASVNAGVTRYVDVYVGPHFSQWAVTSAVDPVTPPVGDRDDILMTINFESYAQDAINPPLQSWAGANKAQDGFRMRNIGNGDYNLSNYPGVAQMEHQAIKGGPHVLLGNRALLLSLYSWHVGFRKPNQSQPDSRFLYVPYSDFHPSGVGVYEHADSFNTGASARLSRMDSDINAYMWQTVFNTSRYSSTRGFNDEFWLGFAIWFPEDFIFDSGPAANLTLLGIGLFGNYSQFAIMMPSTAADATPRLRVELRNWGGVLGAVHNPGDFLLDASTQAAWRGKHVCFVINWKADPMNTGTKTGFFRLWHNVVGQSPTLIWNVQNASFGYTQAQAQQQGQSNLSMRSFQIYKSEWHKRVNNTTDNTEPFLTGTKLLPTSSDAQAGLEWDRVQLGYDEWRLGGSNSNFASVHPLMQEQPA
jgi:hypothetical protein